MILIELSFQIIYNLNSNNTNNIGNNNKITTLCVILMS